MPILDDCNRANGPLGENYITSSGSGLSIIDNAAGPPDNAAHSSSWGTVLPANQEVSCTIVTPHTGSRLLLYTRLQTPDSLTGASYYVARVGRTPGDAPDTVDMFRTLNGSPASMVGATSLGKKIEPGDVLRFKSEGNTHTFYLNGTQIFTKENANIPLGGSIGWGVLAGCQALRIDDLSGGSVGELPGPVELRTLPFAVGDDYGLIPNSPDPQHVKIQQMLDEVGVVKGKAMLGPGKYKLGAKLIRREQTSFCGIGKGTVLEQLDGVNDHVISSDPALDPLAYDHGGGIYDMTIQKNPNSQDTVGHGVYMHCRMGELFSCHGLLIQYMPQSGLRAAHGGAPYFQLHNIHAHWNGDYGVDVEKTSGDRLHCCRITDLSCDNNGIAALHLKMVGDPGEVVRISGIKSETQLAQAQKWVVDLDTMFIGLWIEDIGGTTSGAALSTVDALIRCTATSGPFGGRIHLVNSYIPGFRGAIRDYTQDVADGGRLIPMQNGGATIVYQGTKPELSQGVVLP
jgi:hypothetical protein